MLKSILAGAASGLGAAVIGCWNKVLKGEKFDAQKMVPEIFIGGILGGIASATGMSTDATQAAYAGALTPIVSTGCNAMVRWISGRAKALLAGSSLVPPVK